MACTKWTTSVRTLAADGKKGDQKIPRIGHARVKILVQ